MFENLVEILKKNPRKIVFTEGHDARILEAAARLKKGRFSDSRAGWQRGRSESQCQEGRF